ncbi:DUF1642 domain-containing protein [Streptococcus pluranimalium]
MNQQEAIEEINKLQKFTLEEGRFEIDIVKKSPVIEIIKQIDEPEKPVIPQFVAEKIEYCKSTSGYSLFHAMDYYFQFKESADWLECNEEAFAKAWFYGYTVEKPKLYTVEIPNNDEVSLMLIKNNEHIRLGYSHYVKKVCASSDGCTYKLTEEEIRKDFEWAWQAGFAKGVE